MKTRVQQVYNNMSMKRKILEKSIANALSKSITNEIDLLVIKELKKLMGVSNDCLLDVQR